MLSAVRATIGLYDSVLDFAGAWWHKFVLIWHWFEIPNNVSYYFHNLHSTTRRAMTSTSRKSCRPWKGLPS